jgi:hypothetical protein
MNHVEKALDDILDNDRPCVIAIKGPWGVGKTYFWNEYVKRHKKRIQEKTQVRAYSYCSLFGIESVRELKRLLFAKHISLHDDLKGKAVPFILRGVKQIFAQTNVPYAKD